MKKVFVLIIFIGIGFSIKAQSKSDLAGMWMIKTDVAMKKTIPSYALLNADGTYIWGIDSTQSEPDKNITKGKWDTTSENDLKFIPENSSWNTTYWAKRGDMYQYDGYDKDGKKVPEIVLEMTTYMMRIGK